MWERKKKRGASLIYQAVVFNYLLKGFIMDKFFLKIIVFEWITVIDLGTTFFVYNTNFNLYQN